MKSQLVLATFFLLLWTLTVFVSSQEAKSPEIKVDELADGIKLTCPSSYKITTNSNAEIILNYKDENTGEYECHKDGENADPLKIFVKFRSCDNCVELDMPSIAGMVIGDVVATIVVGVGVYLIASQARTGPVISNKKSKSSDRQHLVSESRGPTNDHYQPLRPRGGQKDTYDELRK